MKWLLNRIFPEQMWKYFMLDYKMYVDEDHYYMHPYWHVNGLCKGKTGHQEFYEGSDCV